MISNAQWRYSGFQVTGMIKGFFEFEIFYFWSFVGRKSLASTGVFYWVA